MAPGFEAMHSVMQMYLILFCFYMKKGGKILNIETLFLCSLFLIIRQAQYDIKLNRNFFKVSMLLNKLLFNAENSSGDIYSNKGFTQK